MNSHSHQASLELIQLISSALEVEKSDRLYHSDLQKTVMICDVTKLLKSGANPNSHLDGAPLLTHCIKNVPFLVLPLLEHGANPNVSPDPRNPHPSALHLACALNHP